ncbi:MAG: multiheme c-type cytochrome [Myxococcaceae bacterium]
MITFAAGLLALVCAAGPTGDSCYRCHAGLPREGAIGEHVSEYEVSVHGRAKIGCDLCHGGNSASSEKTVAHKGVLFSSDEKSTVHSKHQPDTCGQCHPKVLASFKRSKHSQALVTAGIGPTCTTCHTAMGSGIVRPEDIANTCKACHKPGGVAKDSGQALYAARLLVEVTSTQRAIRLAEALVRYSEKRGVKIPDAHRLSEARAAFGGAAESWHVFDPIRTRESIANALKLVDEMRLNLEADTGKQPGKKAEKPPEKKVP